MHAHNLGMYRHRRQLTTTRAPATTDFTNNRLQETKQDMLVK